jgi:hypothetical protein
MVQFLNGFNKMTAKKFPVLGWPICPKIDRLKTKLARFSEVHCSRVNITLNLG